MHLHLLHLLLPLHLPRRLRTKGGLALLFLSDKSYKAMSAKVLWIVAGTLVVVGAGYFMWTSMTPATPVPKVPATPAPGVGTTTPPAGATPAPQNIVPPGPSGTNVMNRGGVRVCSSPQFNNGFLGFFSNDVADIGTSNSYLGALQTTTPDADGTINTATGNIYNWYKFTPGPGVIPNSTPSGSYYVREDQAYLV